MERLPDLRESGRRLAERLHARSGGPDPVVLAPVRGGVPVAAEVAARLALPLDLVLLRRLRVRADGGVACAVAAAGTLLVDDDAEPSATEGDPAYRGFVTEAVAELGRRSALCRGGRPPRPLAGSPILLVDNGIHTGGTVAATLRALRKLSTGPIVVAVPVCNPDARKGVVRRADALVCLGEPRPFGHVGMWYERFEVPALEEVAGIVASVGTAPH